MNILGDSQRNLSLDSGGGTNINVSFTHHVCIFSITNSPDKQALLALHIFSLSISITYRFLGNITYSYPY